MKRPPRYLHFLLLCFGATLVAFTDGPDAAGVVLVDSTEVDGPPFAPLDSTVLTSLGLNDDSTDTVALPFTFTFYGQSYDAVTVSNEGAVFFGVPVAGSSGSCPNGATWNGIAALWQDWSANAVSMATVGRYPNRTVVFSWTGPHGTAGGDGQVQLWLGEARSDIWIVLDDIVFGDPAVDGGLTGVSGASDGYGNGVAWGCGTALPNATTAWVGLNVLRISSGRQTTDNLEAPLEGIDESGLAGASLASSDIDGDGFSDIAVGVPNENEVFIALGATTTWGVPLDALSTKVVGVSGSQMGAAVVLADVDGSGLPSLVVGGPESDLGGTNHGLVALLSTDALVPGSLVVTADADWWATGPSTRTTAATSAASWASPRAGVALSIGDVSGDGYPDVIVGAEEDDSAGTNAGAIYVVYGSLLDWSARPSIALNTADVSYIGTQAGDHLGASILVDDLNLDGIDDIVVGAPYAEPPSGTSNAGRVFALYGAISSGAYLVESSATWTVGGASASGELGRGLALGDVLGNGSADLIVGAPLATSFGVRSGHAAVFDDVTTLTGNLEVLVDSSALWTGVASGDQFGATLAVMDVDADGVDDLIWGAPGADAGVEVGVGAAGVALGPIGAAGDLEDSDWQFFGVDTGGGFGYSLIANVDVDGDGKSGFLVSAPYSSSSRASAAGQVWAVELSADFVDEDGDGFVGYSGGGFDCDDRNSAINPNVLEADGNVLDDDCDGWIDDVLLLRLRDADWRWDVDEELNANPDEDADWIDIEDRTAGDDLTTAFSGSGVKLVASSSVQAADSAFGSAGLGNLVAEITGDGLENELYILFDDEVDALAFNLLDPSGVFEISLYANGDTLLEGEVLDIVMPDRAEGQRVGMVFSQSIDGIRIGASPSDGWGFDDLTIVWADGTDRDKDGYSDKDGDCDDGDPAISPGASEDLSNGVDDDCDGIVDGGDSGIYSDSAVWAADAGIEPQIVDFEALTPGDIVSTDYVDLGIYFNGQLEVSTDVDGALPVASQGGECLAASFEVLFEEVQPAVAVYVLDLAGDLTVEGEAHGVSLYNVTIPLASEDLDGGRFIGFVFDYGVDKLVFSSDTALDIWGVDNLIFSELGLDDADGDGRTEAEGDCDDSDASVSPDALEVWYDGVDADCSGTSDFDVDGDGFDSSAWGGLDCDDVDAARSPGATEVWYDGIDTDCSGSSDFDVDGDGHDSSAFGGDDCDDVDETISPDAVETWYDGVDSDCKEDDDFDADGDGYRSGFAGGGGGVGGTGGVDCDDGDSAVSPGATEVWYDGIDSDCSGDGDFDSDGDGFEAVEWGGPDCNDDDASIFPGAEGDACYDGVDTDCDGWNDDDCDRDGFAHDAYGGLDCDDADSAINPLASDILGDGVDSNCDGAPEFDDDGDGFDGIEDGGTDCNDTDDAIFPRAVEVWYDGVDQDCMGDDDFDADGDGYSSDIYSGLDCNDFDRSIHPGAYDYSYDGIDSDCDGSDDYDLDGDGFASIWYGGSDCDDADSLVFPGNAEIWYDGVDSDCSGGSDFDQDGDGWVSELWGGEDCDDLSSFVAPGVAEVVGDGIDQNCDGVDDVDDDADGFWSSDDCNDSDASIFPGARDACYDGIDADCAGDNDYDCDGDGYSYGTGGDCDDANPLISPAAMEIWYDGVDQDCDGKNDFDADEDGYIHESWDAEGDCNDGDPSQNPGVAGDGCSPGDDDCDGIVDEDCGAGGDEGDGGETGSDGGGTGEDTGADGGSGMGSDSGGGEDGFVDTGHESREPDGSGDPLPNEDWVAPEGSGLTKGTTPGCSCATGSAWATLPWFGLVPGFALLRRRRRHA